MIRLRTGSGIGALALVVALALSPLTVASASSHKGTAKLSTSCPTSAEMTKAAGTAYPAPKVTHATGTVLCNYADPTTGANLELLFQSVLGTTASTLKIVADSQAKAQKTTARRVSGIGSAAYTFTLNNAKANPSGVATTNLLILDGSKLVVITAQAKVAAVKAVARYVLGR